MGIVGDVGLELADAFAEGRDVLVPPSSTLQGSTAYLVHEISGALLLVELAQVN